jgi:hypothetical protein
VATQTVRDLLADNPNGISRPALLAWARLRIDPSMTDAALDAELAALGGDLEDRDGFLRLRGAVVSEPEPTREADAQAPGSAWSPPTPAPEPVIAGRVGPGGVPPTSAADEGMAGGEAVAAWDAPKQGLGKSRVAIAVIVLGIIGAAIVGQTVLKGESVGASDLSIGDCIVVPEAQEFSELDQTACDEPHTGEVFFVGDHPAGDDSAYPSDDEFYDWTVGTCEPLFEVYTGSAYDEQEPLDYGWFTPTGNGWTEGDREVICYLGLASGSATDRSWKDAWP